MNYYPFYHRDFDADTKGLTFTQQGAYRKLLDLFYDTEMPLTKNRLGLYKLVGASIVSERDAVDFVLLGYWTEADEGWIQNRALIELRKMQTRRNAAQANGKRGGRPSKNEVQSVIEMAAQERTRGNPLGYGKETHWVCGEEPSGLFPGNPERKLNVTHAKAIYKETNGVNRKDCSSRAHAEPSRFDPPPLAREGVDDETATGAFHSGSDVPNDTASPLPPPLGPSVSKPKRLRPRGWTRQKATP